MTQKLEFSSDGKRATYSKKCERVIFCSTTKHSKEMSNQQDYCKLQIKSINNHT